MELPFYRKQRRKASKKLTTSSANAFYGDRLLLKMPVRLGPMAINSPKAQISGGKAAFILPTR
jgi:hypothetical protein